MQGLNSQELAAVLAGLRMLQSHGCPEDLQDIATDGGKTAVLTEEQIDELCEKLNGGAETLLLAFWRHDPVLESFIDEYSVGMQPVGAVYTAQGHIVIANGDRSAFYTLMGHDGKVHALREHDAINLVDPEAEVDCLGSFDSPLPALRAVCSAEGWELKEVGAG
jgi:hypothetical protein